MGNIVLLDELTINKIAAGEVIERPASVIKEMVENSIDAGAKTITVEIRNGGISYIRIVDDGSGIAADDLEMAFERHATSKIREADDLQTVKSMGFRGEALASIAAVANVELVSKTENQNVGYRVVVEGGNILNKEEAACSKGTIITVQNLFFNTPVRYKFLKKDYTESGYIEDVITQIALIHPEIAIKFINTGKTVIQTTGNGDITSVVYSIYGKDIAEAIIPTEYVYEDMRIKGVVGKPEIARSNRSRQIFFVNKRHIKDKTLSAAVAEAFKGMIPIGKFGTVILNIDMSPSKVDVNVHPAKLEVRFEEENKVFKAVYHTIKDALLKSELVANTTKEKKDVLPTFSEQSIKSQEKDRESGLFSWKKNRKDDIDKEIKRVEDRDNVISQIYNQKQENAIKASEQLNKNLSKEPKLEGEPINTFEVLQQLKELQSKMKKEVETAKEEIKYKVNEELGENVKKLENSVEEEIAEYKIGSNEDESRIVENIANTETDNQEPILAENEQMPKALQNMENEIKPSEELQQEAQEVKDKIDHMLDNTNQEMPNDFTEMYLKTFGIMPPTEKKEEEKDEKDGADAFDIITDDNNVTMFETSEEDQKPVYRYIGIAFKTYIIIEMNKELYLFDQHAAHERLLYEKVKNNYYSGQEAKNSQLLLLPDLITLTHKEMDIAKDNMAIFEKAGFVLEEFGENTIKLSGVPEICLNLDTRELFLETLDEINTVARTAKQEIEERFLATVACKAAVKAGMTLTEEEVNKLLNELLKLPNPFTCPHGRPTAIKMTRYDLERKFSRK